MKRVLPYLIFAMVVCSCVMNHQTLGSLSQNHNEAEKACCDFFSAPIYDSLIYAKNLLEKQEPEPARCIEVLEKIANTIVEQASVRSQQDSLKAETEVLKKENKIEQQRISLIILSSILVLGLLFLLYFRREACFNRRLEALSMLQLESQQMLDLQKAETASVNAQLEERNAALLALRRQFASLYKAQYKTLNELCAAYLSPTKKDRKDVLYDEVLRQLEMIVNDEDSQDRFMSMVNNSLDGIIDKLRKDLPGHKEQDFRFLMYLIIGFDATTISNLTGYSVGTVYTKKNRLKREIWGLSSPYRDFYLQFLE